MNNDDGEETRDKKNLLTFTFNNTFLSNIKQNYVIK